MRKLHLNIKINIYLGQLWEDLNILKIINTQTIENICVLKITNYRDWYQRNCWISIIQVLVFKLLRLFHSKFKRLFNFLNINKEFCEYQLSIHICTANILHLICKSIFSSLVIFYIWVPLGAQSISHIIKNKHQIVRISMNNYQWQCC